MWVNVRNGYLLVQALLSGFLAWLFYLFYQCFLEI